MHEIMFYWLVAGLVLVMIEIGHPGMFFFLSFACGAWIAAGSALFTDSLIYQSLIFLVASILSCVFLRVFVARMIQSRSHHQTNVYGLIGKKGVVVSPISGTQAGQVKIKGDIWLAYPLHNVPITQGEVEIVKVSGCHVIVQQSIRG